ncbi:unnamed protein product [Chrysoparadoxa australica]
MMKGIPLSSDEDSSEEKSEVQVVPQSRPTPQSRSPGSTHLSKRRANAQASVPIHQPDWTSESEAEPEPEVSSSGEVEVHGERGGFLGRLNTRLARRSTLAAQDDTMVGTSESEEEKEEEETDTLGRETANQQYEGPEKGSANGLNNLMALTGLVVLSIFIGVLGVLLSQQMPISLFRLTLEDLQLPSFFKGSRVCVGDATCQAEYAGADCSSWSPCPEGALCSNGRVIHCETPFQVSSSRLRCEMDQELRREWSMVHSALERQTAANHCSLSLWEMVRSGGQIKSAKMLLSEAPHLAWLPSVVQSGYLHDSLDLVRHVDLTRKQPGDSGEAVTTLPLGLVLSPTHASAVALPLQCRLQTALATILARWFHWVLTALLALVAVTGIDFYRLCQWRLEHDTATFRNMAYRCLLTHARSNGTQPLVLDHIQVPDKRTYPAPCPLRSLSISSLGVSLLPSHAPVCSAHIGVFFLFCPVTLTSLPFSLGQTNVVCWQWTSPQTTWEEEVTPWIVDGPPRTFLLPCSLVLSLP